jgi:hypothetical protein
MLGHVGCYITTIAGKPKKYPNGLASVQASLIGKNPAAAGHLTVPPPGVG